jgi:hypothetical protein
MLEMINRDEVEAIREHCVGIYAHAKHILPFMKEVRDLTYVQGGMVSIKTAKLFSDWLWQCHLPIGTVEHIITQETLDAFVNACRTRYTLDTTGFKYKEFQAFKDTIIDPE